MLSRVGSLLQERLAEGPARVDAITRALTLSERTLHRRLAAEGTTYRALVERVRRELAEQLVGDPAVGVKEMAARLGFASPRAFHRAYQRWHGTTPRGRQRQM